MVTQCPGPFSAPNNSPTVHPESLFFVQNSCFLLTFASIRVLLGKISCVKQIFEDEEEEELFNCRMWQNSLGFEILFFFFFCYPVGYWEIILFMGFLQQEYWIWFAIPSSGIALARHRAWPITTSAQLSHPGRSRPPCACCYLRGWPSMPCPRALRLSPSIPAPSKYNMPSHC